MLSVVEGLLDLERHCVVDLRSDREASTVADWLRQHPQVEIVNRDRGQSYTRSSRRVRPMPLRLPIARTSCRTCTRA